MALYLIICAKLVTTSPCSADIILAAALTSQSTCGLCAAATFHLILHAAKLFSLDLFFSEKCTSGGTDPVCPGCTLSAGV